MENIRFKIARYELQTGAENSTRRCVGFIVEREDNVEKQIYHEIALTGSQHLGKSTEECVDLAFNLLSGSLAISARKLLDSSSDVINSYYIPNL
jgi:hypothetical protein